MTDVPESECQILLAHFRLCELMLLAGSKQRVSGVFPSTQRGRVDSPAAVCSVPLQGSVGFVGVNPVRHAVCAGLLSFGRFPRRIKALGRLKQISRLLEFGLIRLHLWAALTAPLKSTSIAPAPSTQLMPPFYPPNKARPIVTICSAIWRLRSRSSAPTPDPRKTKSAHRTGPLWSVSQKYRRRALAARS